MPVGFKGFEFTMKNSPFTAEAFATVEPPPLTDLAWREWVKQT